MEKPVIEIETVKNNQEVIKAYAGKFNQEKAQVDRLKAYAEKFSKRN